MATLFPWMGGKSRLLKQLIPRLPEHRCYVEVFGGCGALLFKKEPSKVEVYNDLDGELVNTFRIVKHHPDALMSEFSVVLTSREAYLRWKDTPPAVLTDIQRAARFLYLQKLAFSGKTSGRTFGTSTTCKAKLRREPLEKRIQDIHERLQGVTIESLPWQECLTRYDRSHTCFYLDPPYFEAEPYRIAFPEEEYIEMADRLGSLKGKALLSINDHPRIREIFRSFDFEELATRYTYGSADKRVTELLYRVG